MTTKKLELTIKGALVLAQHHDGECHWQSAIECLESALILCNKCVAMTQSDRVIISDWIKATISWLQEYADEGRNKPSPVTANMIQSAIDAIQ